MNFLKKGFKKTKTKKEAPRKMRVVFFTCFSDRGAVQGVFFEGLKRLQHNFAKQVDFTLCIVHSYTDEPEYQLEGIEIHSAYMDNGMVGRKWNHALNMACHFDGDYYVKIDDDDVVSNAGFEQMLKYMAAGVPYLGFDHVVFMDGYTQQASYFKYPNRNKVLGAIRAFSWDALNMRMRLALCDVLQAVNQEGLNLLPGEQRYLPAHVAIWMQQQGIVKAVIDENRQPVTRLRLWTMEWNRSLDWDCDVRLAMQGIVATAVPVDHAAVLDIKTDTNIWSYQHRAGEGQPYCFESLDWLSEGEKTRLNYIKNSKAKPGKMPYLNGHKRYSKQTPELINN